MNTRRGELRQQLHAARLCLLFTPALCLHLDPMEVLEATLDSVDLIQLRIKAPGSASSASELFQWGERLLTELASKGQSAPPLVINDRVDVAACLMHRGLAGVHLGQTDTEPKLARQLLGDSAIVGLSTHSAADVARANEAQVDYLGFGPIYPTETKGYDRGLGSHAAWIMANACNLPVFPIGGIDLFNAAELAPVGRAAICSAILSAEDPGASARNLRQALIA